MLCRAFLVASQVAPVNGSVEGKLSRAVTVGNFPGVTCEHSEGRMNTDAIKTNALAAAWAEEEKRGERKRESEIAQRSWHLVQIRAKAIDLATRHLKERGYEVYSPQLRTLVIPRAMDLSHVQRKHRHLMTREKILPFFPGYSFVHFDVSGDPWHDIFKLVGVYGIACTNNMPKAMPDEFIARLRAKEVNGAIPGETPIEEMLFHVGDTARPNEGPFIGHTGPVDKVDEAGRISLLLTFLGSTRSVTFTSGQLDKLSATPAAIG